MLFVWFLFVGISDALWHISVQPHALLDRTNVQVPAPTVAQVRLPSVDRYCVAVLLYVASILATVVGRAGMWGDGTTCSCFDCAIGYYCMNRVRVRSIPAAGSHYCSFGRGP